MENNENPGTYEYLVYIASEKNDKIRDDINVKLLLSILQKNLWLKLQDTVLSNKVRLSDIVN
jgi:hypothetical protein